MCRECYVRKFGFFRVRNILVIIVGEVSVFLVILFLIFIFVLVVVGILNYYLILVLINGIGLYTCFNLVCKNLRRDGRGLC